MRLDYTIRNLQPVTTVVHGATLTHTCVVRSDAMTIFKDADEPPAPPKYHALLEYAKYNYFCVLAAIKIVS